MLICKNGFFAFYVVANYVGNISREVTYGRK